MSLVESSSQRCHAKCERRTRLMIWKVAAHESEAVLVNARDPEACDARFLGFPVGPYTVDRALEDGEVIAEAGLEVVHTPGQTPGHVVLWDPRERIALTGDLLPAGDVSWVPYARPWSMGPMAAGKAICCVPCSL